MTTMSIPFSDHEKRFLLAEIIKTSPVPLDSLLRIVKEENIQPNWNEIFLPTARNVNSCRAAFSDLLSNSPASFQHQGSTFDQATPPIQSKKRRHSDAEPSIPSNIRTLKPKPAENGEQSGTFRSSSGNVPKKRGRPSKEELAQRQAEAIARGEVYPPLKQVRKSAGSAAPIAPLTFSAGPSREQPAAVSDAPGSAKKKRGRPNTAGKDDAVARTTLESPSDLPGAAGRSAEDVTNTTDMLQVQKGPENDTLLEPPTQSTGVEIPDSTTSSNTLSVAPGPI